ncbi:hypothetical protein LMG7053_01554 [Achromobacter ruhlandii]|uniref:Uncharacterized protein n=1 Tax=Achromobacter ruhlandii TaxID=72557 RepID=A0ABM8LRE1_9BURK|nr:hypothetical protein LMG7053_01554 [Achromobacter ruhlandii]
MAAFLDNQLDEAACVEVGKRTRHVVQGQGATVGLDPVVMRFRFAVAHGRHLRIGKHHGRHRGQVEGRVSARHVDRGTGAGRCRHIDELRLVGAVAGRVDVRATRAHALVDDDGPLRIDGDPRRVQCQAARVRCPPGGDQQFVGAYFTVPRGQHEFAVHMGDLAGLRVFQHRDPFGTESVGDGLADGRVFAEEQGAARQDRHLAAQSGKGLRQFQRHHRRADHGQAFGNGVADQGLGRSPVG